MAKLSKLIQKHLGGTKPAKKKPEGLMSAVGSKVFGKPAAKESKLAPAKLENAAADTSKQFDQMQDDMSILAKNSMTFNGIARDFNVMRQNFVKLVKDMGLKPALGADMHMLKESERGAKLGVEREKESSKRPSKTPTPEGKKPVKDKGGSKNKWMMLLGILSDPNVLILAIYGALKLAEFFTELWDDIVQGFQEWIIDGKLWMVIKEKASAFVDWVADTFTLENLMKFVDDPGKYLKMMWESVTGFFGSVGDFVSDKFDSIKSFFGLPVEPKDAKIPEFQTEKQELEPPIDVQTPPEPKQTFTKEQIAAQEAAEKKAGYTGQDETVRERMGLKGPSAAEMRGEVPQQYVRDSQGNTVKDSTGSPVKYGAPGQSDSKSPEKVPSVSVGGDDKSVMAMIKKHEGVRNKPYQDSLGLWTVGVGHLIGDGKSLPPEWNRTFSDQEIDALFAKDYQHHKEMAMNTPGWDKANDKGRAAMIDLAFNMGGSWYKKFKNAAAALAAGDFNKAADELQNSQWYKQVKGRAVTITQLIREGMGKSTSPTSTPGTTVTAAATPAKTPSSTSGNASLNSSVKVASGVDIANFKSSLEERVALMAKSFYESTGKKLLITSGFRDNGAQKKLWDAALAKNGGDAAATRKMVAEPMPPLGNGRGSQHAFGMAIDINSKGSEGLNVLAGPRDKPTGWLEKFGLTRPVPGEDWHVQLLGSPPASDNPANPGKPALVADKAGKPVDVSSGKKDSAPQAPAIAQASAEVASGQRKQVADANQPVVINNTTTVTSNQNVTTKKAMVCPTCSSGSDGRRPTDMSSLVRSA